MASLLSLTYPRLLTVEEFLQIDFGPGLKAELDSGHIHMMASGSRAHARVQMNLYRFLGGVLRGSGCRPFGSDMGILTKDMSLRYPDLTVDCGTPDDASADQVLGNPRVLMEVLSPSTRDYDLRTKQAEYRQIDSVQAIAFIDPDAETLSISLRTADGWTDSPFMATDLRLPDLDIVVPYAEVFAQD